ncbi:MAG: hypothetical protein ACE5LS_05620 [Thermoplasmata archaeon]
MNRTRRIRGTSRAAKTAGAARSRIGRLLALLSVLTAVGRGPSHGVAATLPSYKRYPTDRRHPIPGGHDLVTLLR